MPKFKNTRTFKRCFKNSSGSITIFTALSLSVLMVTAGAGIDYARSVSLKTELQQSADAASLATATKLMNGKIDKSNAEDFARKVLKANLVSRSNDAKNSTIAHNIEIDESAGAGIWRVTVDSSVNLNTTILRIAGIDTIDIGVVSVAETSKKGNGVSIFLGLNYSGSSSPFTDATKAGIRLADRIDKADPNGDYLRYGVDGWGKYNSGGQYGTHMDWGTDNARQRIAGYATNQRRGKTNSSTIFYSAFYHLGYLPTKTWSRINEIDVHKNKHGGESEQIAIIITHENNSGDDKMSINKSDAETRRSCDNLKDQNIKVYTIAYRMAMRVNGYGRESSSSTRHVLKYCATSSEHYFDTDSQTTLDNIIDEITTKYTGDGNFTPSYARLLK